MNSKKNETNKTEIKEIQDYINEQIKQKSNKYIKKNTSEVEKVAFYKN